MLHRSQKSINNRKISLIFLILTGGMFLLIFGAIKLRTDLLVIGLIPFIITGFEYIIAQKLYSSLKYHYLKGSISYKTKSPVQNEYFDLSLILANPLPFGIGNVSLIIRTEHALKVPENIRLYIPAFSKVTYQTKLLPIRPGPLFFYGFIVVLETPFAFFSKKYYVSLPTKLNVLPQTKGVLSKFKNNEYTSSKIKIPSANGEFAYLKKYQYGDPWKSIVWSISMKRKQPIVRMASPEENQKWALGVDVSPSFFYGKAGKTQFDITIPMLQQLITQISFSVASLSLIVFNEFQLTNYSLNYKSNLADIIGKYRLKNRCNNLNFCIDMLIHHLSLNYGYKITYLENSEKNKTNLHKQLLNFAKTFLIKKINIEKLQKLSLEKLILKITEITGLEIPQEPSTELSLKPLINTALNKGINKLFVFSSLDLIKQVETEKLVFFASKKHLEIRFFIPDTDFILQKHHGFLLFDKSVNYRLYNLPKQIKKSGGIVEYWNPQDPTAFIRLLKSK